MHSNNSFFDRLNEEYPKFHVKNLVTNRFSYADFRQAVSHLDAEWLKEEEVGDSVEGRRIYAYTIGTGPIKVLMWSQMHGNESTATRALLDLFKFFTTGDGFEEERQAILDAVTIKIIPMLNPDGTERFQRRNAQGIDLNRDARALQAPESRVLKAVFDDFLPAFAFNLHDQRRMYNVTGTDKPATISFLAPAYNEGEEINHSRTQAMQLIACLNDKLQQVIPGSVGKYDDAYSYRSFGDNVQAWGASTVLVEAGWTKDDMEKEQVRKLNFLILMSAIEAISRNTFTSFDVKAYEAIPMNDEKMVDVLITCANHKVNGFSYVTDIAVNRMEVSIPGTRHYYSVGTIDDIGDLSSFYAFRMVDECDLFLKKGEVYEPVLQSIEEVEELDFNVLLEQGILFVSCAELPEVDYTDLPINIISPDIAAKVGQIDFESKANFLLADADNTVKYVVLNGFLIQPMDKIDSDVHGLVMR